jgi:hypothetical protein
LIDAVQKDEVLIPALALRGHMHGLSWRVASRSEYFVVGLPVDVVYNDHFEMYAFGCPRYAAWARLADEVQGAATSL